MKNVPWIKKVENCCVKDLEKGSTISEYFLAKDFKGSRRILEKRH